MTMRKMVFLVSFPMVLFLFPLLLTSGGFLLTGCSSDSSDYYKEDSPESEQLVFSVDEYPYINQFLGAPTNLDIMDALDAVVETTDAFNHQAYTGSDDWNSLMDLFQGLYGLLADTEGERVSPLNAQDTSSFYFARKHLLEILTIANDSGVAETLNQMIGQMGADVLTAHLFPMMEYAFSAEALLSENSTQRDENKLTKEEFDTLITILRRMFDTKDKVYGDIWSAIFDLSDIIKTRQISIPVGDAKELFGSLFESLVETITGEENANQPIDPVLSAVIDAFKKLLNEGSLSLAYELTEDGTVKRDENGDLIPLATPVSLTFKGELRKLIYAASLLATGKIASDGHNAWDTGANTDTFRILQGMKALLDDSNLPRETFRNFLNTMISAAVTMDGANSLGGTLRAVASTDTAYLQGIDYGVSTLIQVNRSGVARDASATSKTSALRVLLYMVDALNRDVSAGSLIGTTDDCSFPWTCTVSRDNLMSWAMGEMSTALDRYPANPFDGLDYLFYQKNYVVLIGGLPVFPSEGLFGLLNNAFINGALTIINFDEFIPAAHVAVGEGDVNGAMKTGVSHQLLALAAPVIQHFWKWKGDPEQNWEHPVVEMLARMNEINSAASFSADNVTGVVKTLEGKDGYGIFFYGLRSHAPESDPAGDAGMLDPVLNLMAMAAREMISKEFTYTGCKNPCLLYCDDQEKTCTLFSALMDYLETHEVLGVDIDEDYAEWVPSLFDPDADTGKVKIDQAYEFLTRHIDAVDALAQGAGAVLKAISADQARFDKILDDMATLIPIVKKLLKYDEAGIQKDTAIKDYIDILLSPEEDGSDNPFMLHLKTLVFKLLTIKSETFNPDGVITGDQTLSDWFIYLFGDENSQGGVYDSESVRTFREEMRRSNIDLFDRFIEKPLGALLGNTPSSGSFSKDNLPTAKALNAMTLSVDVDGDGILDKPILYLFLDIFDIETDMAGLLNESLDLMDSPDLEPGGYLYEFIVDIMNLAEERISG